MNLNQSNINIIGGSGFIGTRLIHSLNENGKENIRILDKVISQSFPSCSEICDVRSIDELNNKITSNSIIINLAAEHHDNVSPTSLYKEVNVDGANNICVAAREKNVTKIIFTSSVAVYGDVNNAVNEDCDIKPSNEYGKTKYEAELIFRAWQEEEPEVRSLIIIRPTVVFGENNRGNVYNLIKQVSSGRFVMIGRGDNRKSMAYVGNLVCFIIHCLEYGNGIHIFNYVDKPDYNMNELIIKICDSLNIKMKFWRLPFILGYLIGLFFDLLSLVTKRLFPISSIRVKKFCSDSVFVSNKITTFQPPIPLNIALNKTIQHDFLNK